MTLDRLIFDPWTPMSFKSALGRRSGSRAWAAPSWVGDEHSRRLTAYAVLQSYIDNAARLWMLFVGSSDEDPMDRAADHREYGDAALIRNAVMAALLGEDYEIQTDGADAYRPEAEDDEGLTEEEREASREAEDAYRLQEWMREWANNERFQLKLIETERNAVGLGDGTYVLGWSAKRERPRLRVYDPGFYFPVLDDDDDEEYPSKVHIAWEIAKDDGEAGPIEVRRITYELVTLPDGETRTYPWSDKPSNVTCLMSDGVWRLDSTRGFKVDDLSPGSGTYKLNEDGEELRDFEIGTDFIPVVHVPNTVALQEHYGRSSLSTVLQILDDLANADTDLQAASATTGNPVIAVSGNATTDGKRLTYEPGTVFNVGDGRMTALDTSKSLDALLKYVAHLLDRLTTNSRLPDAVLGRVDPSEAPSGVAIALTFGPLVSMINEMRLVRDEKYQLLFKFAHRFALLGGLDVPDEYTPTRLAFGSYLPQDASEAVSLVERLLNAKAISLETAVRMLMDAGLPIEDAVKEVARIEGRDFEGATKLLDATGDDAAVFEYLGREVPEGREIGSNGVPPIQVPPPPPPPAPGEEGEA